jgi:hypothetical protein
MKTFKNVCAQGDVTFRRVTAIPSSATPVPPNGAHVVLAHSETGHHHVMLAERTELFQDHDNELIAWIN